MVKLFQISSERTSIDISQDSNKKIMLTIDSPNEQNFSSVFYICNIFINVVNKVIQFSQHLDRPIKMPGRSGKRYTIIGYDNG